MPVYDYVCTSCGHRFEVLRGLNEAGPHQCPLCEGPVIRAFAPPTILFKGSGWAKNDRRSAGASTRKAAVGQGKSGDSDVRRVILGRFELRRFDVRRVILGRFELRRFEVRSGRFAGVVLGRLEGARGILRRVEVRRFAVLLVRHRCLSRPR